MPTKLSPAIERELGHATGLGSTQDWPHDPAEEAPELLWPANVAVYARMLRTDAQVGGTFRAITLPIRKATWRVDPNGARPEVVSLVAEDLGLTVLGAEAPPARPRSKGRFSFDEHLRMALLSLAYGHMGFEQVYRIEAGRARLRKLGPRMPQTLSKIKVAPDGGLDGVEQYGSGRPGDPLSVPISIDRLVWYANDREGGNWAGQSIFRSAYKHWLLKDRLLRVQAMTIERNGMGVPTVEAPQGATPAMMTELNTLAQSYRAGEASGGAIPYGGRLRLVGVEGTLPDALPVIRYHDGSIAKNVLAQFLELGSTETGSRALGSAFIDFFLLALQAVAGSLASTMTEHVVEDIVDLNWGEDEPAPRVVTSELDAPGDIPPEALVALIDSQAVTPDDDLEDHLRERYRLPRRGTPRPPANEPITASRPDVRNSARTSVTSRRTSVTSRRTSVIAAAARTGAQLHDELFAHYQPAIAEALAAGVDATAVATEALDQTAVAAAMPVDDADLARARAILDAHGFETDALASTLDELNRDAYAAGAHAGWLTLPVEVRSVGAEPFAAIDWDTWVPGHPLAADELAGVGEGRGLARMLEEADVRIAGMSGTATEDLARVLARGVAAGDSVETIASALESKLGGGRALTIANTEVARAMSIASMDTYSANGVAGVEWLVANLDTDETCTGNAGAGPIALGETFPSGDTEPPAHPNCRCAIAPVMVLPHA
jgi:hypothetical protein